MMTNLPVPQIDVWKPATEADKAAALALFATLPSRQMSSKGLDRASYFMALEGVTRYGLSEAVKAILRGALGHEFFPSPPALRMQCDKAMKPHEDQRARIAHRARLAKEQAEHRSVQPKTSGQIERARRLMEDFNARHEQPEDKVVSTLDPKLVALVPDNPAVQERMGDLKHVSEHIQALLRRSPSCSASDVAEDRLADAVLNNQGRSSSSGSKSPPPIVV